MICRVREGGVEIRQEVEAGRADEEGEPSDGRTVLVDDGPETSKCCLFVGREVHSVESVVRDDEQ